MCTRTCAPLKSIFKWCRWAACKNRSWVDRLVCMYERPCIHYSGVETICRQLVGTGCSEKLISMLVQVSYRTRDTGGFETDMNPTLQILRHIFFFLIHFLAFFPPALLFKGELIFMQKQMLNMDVQTNWLFSVMITRKKRENRTHSLEKRCVKVL